MNVTQEYHFRVPLSLIFKPSLSAILFVMVISCSSTLKCYCDEIFAFPFSTFLVLTTYLDPKLYE